MSLVCDFITNYLPLTLTYNLCYGVTNWRVSKLVNVSLDIYIPWIWWSRIVRNNVGKHLHTRVEFSVTISIFKTFFFISSLHSIALRSTYFQSLEE